MIQEIIKINSYHYIYLIILLSIQSLLKNPPKSNDSIIFIIFNMLQKWSDKEDQQLSRIIRKYGTTDWTLIRKQFKSSRSRDSVIKRWHGKLKYDKINLPKTKKIVPPQIKPQTNARRDRQTTRSGGKFSNKNIRHYPLARTKFRRLQNFITGTVATRTKKPKLNHEIKPASPIIEQQSSEHQQFLTNWSKSDDEKLRNLVIQQGITNWSKLSTLMNCGEKEVQKRWRQSIYQTIQHEDKVGGFMKYSHQEDTIVTIGHRNGLSWEELSDFLPERSEFSIEARWRRLVRPQLQFQLSKNKHYFMREFMKKIVQKKREEKEMVPEKPQSEKQAKTS